MSEDKAWDRIVDAIDMKFGLKDHGKETRPVADAQEFTEYVSFVVFERAGERYKLERVQGPAITERKTIGARRAGATVRMQNVYDPHEVSFRTNLFREDAGEWVSIDAHELGL